MTMTPQASRVDIRLWTVMRGFAALAVVLFHFKAHVAYPLVAIPVLGPIIRHGDLGVDMFFTLSGFVMAYVYGLPAPGPRFAFGKFYIRRIARIYPVHFVTLIGALVMLIAGAALHLVVLDPGLLARSVPIQLLLLHGIGTDIAPTLNYPSWSVSSEMFAYLLFPVFAWAYRAMRSPIPLILAAIAMLYVMFDATSLAVFGGVRVSVEFVLGMGLCPVLSGHHNRGAGLTAMALGLALFVVLVILDGPRSIAILGLVIVIGGAFVGDRRDDVISLPMRALVYLGQISYSIYMVHALIEAPGFKIAQILTGAPEDRNSVYTLLVLMVVTLVAAALLYHLVEQPCRRTIVAYADRRTGSRIAGAATATRPSP